jgi:hypothetical protein
MNISLIAAKPTVPWGERAAKLCGGPNHDAPQGSIAILTASRCPLGATPNRQIVGQQCCSKEITETERGAKRAANARLMPI